MADIIKDKVLIEFERVSPNDLSIKDTAKRVKADRDTTSKYIHVLVAEGKLKFSRKIGNTKFFQAIPSTYIQGKYISSKLEEILPDLLHSSILKKSEIRTLEETKEILKKIGRKNGA